MNNKALISYFTFLILLCAGFIVGAVVRLQGDIPQPDHVTVTGEEPVLIHEIQAGSEDLWILDGHSLVVVGMQALVEESVVGHPLLRCVAEDLLDLARVDHGPKWFLGERRAERDVALLASGRDAVTRVPADRWKILIMMRRALLRGKMTYQARKSYPSNLLDSFGAVLFYSVSLLFLWAFAPVFGFEVFMKTLIRDCDHLGKILALFGIDPVKHRYIVSLAED